MRFAGLLVAGLSVAVSSVPAQSAGEAIDRAIVAWSGIRTLRASFEQSITNPLTGSALTSRGTIQQRRPDKLAIAFTEPAGDRIVADGQFVWVFLQSATPGQVLKMTRTSAGAGNADLLGQFLDAPRAKYDVEDAGTEVLDGRKTRAFVLAAKPGQALPFTRATVWIDDEESFIRQFESTEPSGITRRVRVLSMAPNATVDASAFVFRVPAGVRVVEPPR